MTLPIAFLDVAIDKATLDAMLYGTLRDPEDKVKANVKAYLDDVARLWRPEGGKWPCARTGSRISCGHYWRVRASRVWMRKF